MSETIRTLGLYQPFATLMLHGKVETRWVREGRKPPFVFGKYLLYSTNKQYSYEEVLHICGEEQLARIKLKLIIEKDSFNLPERKAICVGELEAVYPMKEEHEDACFVKYYGRSVLDNITKIQWCLRFVNVRKIEQFGFPYGKQGVGIFPNAEFYKIKYIL